MLIIVTAVYVWKTWQLVNIASATLEDSKKTSTEYMDRIDKMLKSNKELADHARILADNAGPQTENFGHVADAAVRSAGAAETSAREATKSNRPYIGLDTNTLELRYGDDNPMELKFNLVNNGSNPGLVHTFIAAEIRLDAIPHPRVDRSIAPKSVITIRGHDLSPTVAQLMRFKRGTSQQMESGQTFLFIYVEAIYKDSAGHQYFSHWCGQYNPSVHSFDLCSVYNDGN
jgi:hypothetical protein